MIYIHQSKTKAATDLYKQAPCTLSLICKQFRSPFKVRIASSDTPATYLWHLYVTYQASTRHKMAADYRKLLIF